MNEVEMVMGKLAEAIKARQDAVVRGAVSSYEEYRHVTGVIAGLQGAYDALKEVNDQYEDA